MAVVVQQQDARDDPESERQDDDREVLRLEAESLLGERRAEHAEDSHERRGDREVDERPGDVAVAADERDPLAKLSERPTDRALGVADAEPGMRVLGRRGWRRGRRERDAEECGEEVQRSDDDDDGLGTGHLDDQRPEQREAHRERRVEGQGEDAVGRQQLAARDQDRDHREFGRGEEHGDRRDGNVEQQDQCEVGARQVEGHECGTAKQIGSDQDDPSVDPVHVDACDGREQHGGHEERQDEQADGGV